VQSDEITLDNNISLVQQYSNSGAHTVEITIDDSYIPSSTI